jgi:2'-5' RNA ligase
LLELGQRARSLNLPGGARLRWLSDEQLHVTLKFLGSVPSAALPRLSEALLARARNIPSFEAQAAHLGAFPSPARATVLVVRLTDEHGHLARLASWFEDDAAELGVPREQRSFKAHVTLARLRQPDDVRPLIHALPVETFAMTFDEVRLYASTRHASGSAYSVLAAARLGTSAD